MTTVAFSEDYYHFYLTVLLYFISDIYCYLYHNSRYITLARTTSNNHGASAAVTVYLYLDIGDTVDFRYCGNWQEVSTGAGTIFTGALIMPS